MKDDKWMRYAYGEPSRIWWCKAGDDNEWFYEDEAAAAGWRRYTQPGSLRPWLCREDTGDWFFLDTGRQVDVRVSENTIHIDRICFGEETVSGHLDDAPP